MLVRILWQSLTTLMNKCLPFLQLFLKTTYSSQQLSWRLEPPQRRKRTSIRIFNSGLHSSRWHTAPTRLGGRHAAARGVRTASPRNYEKKWWQTHPSQEEELKSLTCGEDFNQSIENVTLPSDDCTTWYLMNNSLRAWSDSVEQSLNLIFKLDTVEQCLIHMKAFIHVSFIHPASQPAIMIALIHVSFISFIWKPTSYETHIKTKSQRLDKSG